MTPCDEVREHMSAALDNELDPPQTQDLQSHLEQCEACREQWSLLVQLDRRLRDELVLDIPHGSERLIRSQSNSPNGRWNPAIYLAGLAAVMLLCIGVANLGPWKAPLAEDIPSELDDTVLDDTMLDKTVLDKTVLDKTVLDKTVLDDTVVAATLVHATGPFEVFDVGAGVWTACSPGTLPVLEPGARLRTLPQALCEFQTVENGTIRLDEDAELVWKDTNELLLVKGRMWCVAPTDQSISVQLPFYTENRIATFVCPSQSESHYAAQPQSISCTSTSVENRVVTADCDAWSGDVSPGETLLIANEPNVQRDEQLVAAAKVWQLPLLALDDQRHSELKESMAWLLAPIGYTKARHFNEQQIRALGPRGAIPLLAYVQQSADQPNQQTTRRTAMRLALDVSDATALPLLEVLSSDPDTTVADLARRIIERIQG